MSPSHATETTSHTRDRFLSLTALAVLGVFLWFAHNYLSGYVIRILNTIAIYIIVAVSYNLINGVTGQFSLQPNAFLAIGAYVTAILALSPEEKVQSFIIEPMIWPLSKICLHFPVSLAIGGLFTTLIAFLMAVPVFRVRGDYLAIVTLGFGEVLQVLANNLVPITNGPLGLKGLHPYTTLWWSWGLCIMTVFCVVRLVNSSYGRAMKAVREDERAAEAMGINAFWTKTLAFTVSAFFQGVAGGLLAHLITTISPGMFGFMLTFNLLTIIVVGGLGSTTGAILSAAIIVLLGEGLRTFEEPFTLFGHYFQGVAGMRMVIFSLLLIVVMLFADRGIMGREEFSWRKLIDWARSLAGGARRGRK
ncbi:MAG: branched-chain amino acid ABC transporter permease [Thermodesulfobacteriota bacterium]